MRSRSGGVLSASVLVALGTSILLAALIGLGLSELGSPPRGGGTGSARAAEVAVVVPAITAQRHVAAGKVRHSSTSTRSSIPVVTPTVKASAAAATSPTRTTTVRRERAAPTPTRKSSSAAPSPSPTHGNGKGKAKGRGNGHKKA